MCLKTVVFLLVVFCAAAHGVTYTFSFRETNLNNFLQVYYLNVQIDVDFDVAGGAAMFTTTVLSVTPLHFSMFVNGRK
uniref:Uncharacterized protein n=1 Tax=Caenorhabditis japonica TaxID=281687 RepID=A0A8R1IMK6_CAEJA